MRFISHLSLEEKNNGETILLTYPFICCCRELAKDFVVAGTASESLYGACESLFKPDLVSH